MEQIAAQAASVIIAVFFELSGVVKYLGYYAVWQAYRYTWVKITLFFKTLKNKKGMKPGNYKDR